MDNLTNQDNKDVQVVEDIDIQDEDMYVTKRSGKTEIISFDKILKRVKNLGHEFNLSIQYTQLVMKVIDQLYNNIKTSEIDELTAQQCASMASINPDYKAVRPNLDRGDGTADAAKTFEAKEDQGYVNLDANGDTITITTCFQNECASATEDTVANNVEVAE